MGGGLLINVLHIMLHSVNLSPWSGLMAFFAMYILGRCQSEILGFKHFGPQKSSRQQTFHQHDLQIESTCNNRVCFVFDVGQEIIRKLAVGKTLRRLVKRDCR
jgi:hypothetical protein